MRVLDCECGRRLEANDDEELYGQAREHVDHPEMQLSDEQVR